MHVFKNGENQNFHKEEERLLGLVVVSVKKQLLQTFIQNIKNKPAEKQKNFYLLVKTSQFDFIFKLRSVEYMQLYI